MATNRSEGAELSSGEAARQALLETPRAPRRTSSLELVLGAPAVRCPIADRAVRIVRGEGTPR